MTADSCARCGSPTHAVRCFACLDHRPFWRRGEPCPVCQGKGSWTECVHQRNHIIGARVNAIRQARWNLHYGTLDGLTDAQLQRLLHDIFEDRRDDT